MTPGGVSESFMKIWLDLGELLSFENMCKNMKEKEMKEQGSSTTISIGFKILMIN